MRDHPPYQVLTDAEFDERMSMRRAVAVIRRAIQAHGAGTLHAPSRFTVDAGDGSLVFTVGMETESFDVMGFRVYETVPESPDDHQLVATFHRQTGTFEGVIIGHRVGAVRTGATGGVAIDELARDDAQAVGILGSGRQARTQLAALAAVRDLRHASVYSPTASHRRTFASELGDELDLDVNAVASNEAAVRGADVLITATTSREPVFDPAWLEAGCHVNAVGPKFTTASELDPAVADVSDVIVTDSLAQVDAYEPEFFLTDTEHRHRMVELADVVSGASRGRTRDDDITLFCSVGLAGTEVLLAHEAFQVAS